MKCYLHNELDAVASCNCGRGLCNSCAGNFTPPACQTCAETTNERLVEEKKKPIITTTIVAVVGFLIVFATIKDVVGAIAATWFILGVYWGWALVRPMLIGTAIGSIFLGGTGFVLGMIFAGLATFLGMFIGPFLLIKNIIEYQQSKKLLEATKKLSSSA